SRASCGTRSSISRIEPPPLSPPPPPPQPAARTAAAAMGIQRLPDLVGIGTSLEPSSGQSGDRRCTGRVPASGREDDLADGLPAFERGVRRGGVAQWERRVDDRLPPLGGKVLERRRLERS